MECSLKYIQHISGLMELQPLYLALQYIRFYICMQKYVKLWLFSSIFVAHIVHSTIWMSTLCNSISCILYISHIYIHLFLLASHSGHMYALAYLFFQIGNNQWRNQGR